MIFFIFSGRLSNNFRGRRFEHPTWIYAGSESMQNYARALLVLLKTFQWYTVFVLLDLRSDSSFHYIYTACRHVLPREKEIQPIFYNISTHSDLEITEVLAQFRKVSRSKPYFLSQKIVFRMLPSFIFSHDLVRGRWYLSTNAGEHSML